MRREVKMTRIEFVWPGTEYDPLRHITALELRAIGFVVEGCVPDCAWVDRDSINVAAVCADQSKISPDVMDVRAEFNCGSFSWKRVEYEIDASREQVIADLKGVAD